MSKYLELIKEDSQITPKNMFSWNGKRYRKTPAYHRSQEIRKELRQLDRQSIKRAATQKKTNKRQRGL